jgi:hypothetical protein
VFDGGTTVILSRNRGVVFDIVFCIGSVFK